MDFEQKQGLNRQYSKQDIDVHRALGGTPDIFLSFLLSHLNKRFHLERVLFFRATETVLETHDDG